jgi:hypothetical protein
MKQNIELRKLRDFGQVFTDTFVFFKDNLKPLLRALFVICGVFMLIGSVGSAATYLNKSSVFDLTRGINSYDVEGHTATYFISAFITTAAMLIAQSCINLVTLCYISVYLQNKGEQPSITQVWGFFKYYFWRVLGSSILLGIFILIGACFCILPGIYLGRVLGSILFGILIIIGACFCIYLGIVFTLVIPIIVMENASFGYAFNKSFKLIRDNWWFVFGVLIVISIIVAVASSIASIPLSVIPLLSKFLTNSLITTPLIIFFSVLRNLLMVAYSLTAIAIALCYFDLSEQKEGTGLMARIEDFGKAEPEETPGQEPAGEY